MFWPRAALSGSGSTVPVVGPNPPTMPMLECRWHHRWLLTSRTLCCENVVSGRRLAADHQQPSQGYWLLSVLLLLREAPGAGWRPRRPAMESVVLQTTRKDSIEPRFRSCSLLCGCGGSSIAVESGIGSRHHRRVTAALLMGWRSDGLVMENQNPNIKSLEME